MSKSSFWNYVKTASVKLAEYTGYVHLATYLAIWICLIDLLSLSSASFAFRFFVATFLGAIIAVCFGILFWFFPYLIVRWKKRKGKNWNGFLAVINVGLIRFIVLPCLTLAIFFFIAAPMIRSIDSNRRSDLESSFLASDSDCKYSMEAEDVFEKTKADAKKGDPEAQARLGFMYNEGKGVPRDWEEGVKWYRNAANQGHPNGQFNLANCYADGRGIERNYKEAIKWYTLSANQGYASSQNNLGVIYREGEGVSQDYEEAFKWFKLASDQGDATAQCSLAFQYFNGLGVEKNIPKAVKWYILAADRGNQMAKKSLKNLKKTLSPSDLDQGKKLAETWRKNHE